MAWKRSGECNRCGECCATGGNVSPVADRHPGACGYFRWDDETMTRGSCIGRATPFYLAGCNVWPTVPEHIADCPSCSYTFEWVDE